MKNHFYTLVTVLSFVLLTSSAFAQTSTEKDERKFTKNGITNLISGVKSDNPGLKKSAIFMAGRYKVIEMEDVLIDELYAQKDTEIKLLIAKVLHHMYSEKGMIALQDFVKDTTDKKLQKFAALFIADYNNSLFGVAQN